MHKLLICFALLLLVGCSEANSTSSGPTSTLVVDVPGIHCESCAAKVTKVLGEQPGVNKVEVDVDTKQATVSIDKKVLDGNTVIAVLDDYQFSGSTIVGDDAK